jgi:sugar fermentation stimulation protein A
LGCCSGPVVLGVGVEAWCWVRRRVNRFVVEVVFGDGGVGRVHLNNTGRLVGVLVEGRRAACTRVSRPGRYRLRLSFVEYGCCDGGLAVVDTGLQERAFAAAVEAGLLPWLRGCRVVARGPRVGGSRLDYRLDCGGVEVLVETKSAVLASGDCLALYPDCPTGRGRRHMLELTGLAAEGRRAVVVFVAGFPGARGFRPNEEADPGLARALRRAVEAGVEARSIGLCYSPGEGGVVLYSADLPVLL